MCHPSLGSFPRVCVPPAALPALALVPPSLCGGRQVHPPVVVGVEILGSDDTVVKYLDSNSCSMQALGLCSA